MTGWRAFVGSTPMFFVLGLLLACGAATSVPPSGRAVHVSLDETGLQLEPASVPSGDVYLVLEEPVRTVEFVGSVALPDVDEVPGVPGAPLPLRAEDIASLEQTGSFRGAYHISFGVHDTNVVKVGTLVPGKYAVVLDRKLAILEVRE